MKTLMAVALAAVVNVLLFAMMERMVAARFTGWEGGLETLSLDIVRLPATPPPATERDRAEPDEADAEPEPQLAPPQRRVAPLRKAGVAAFVSPEIPRTEFAVRGSPSLAGVPIFEELSKPLQPTVRVNPQYPRRALLRKIEGYVVVGFTIQPDGTTTALEILDAEPKGVFDRSALEAVRRWRFEPQVEPRVDSTKFEFELSGS
jgi:protein TonB